VRGTERGAESWRSGTFPRNFSGICRKDDRAILQMLYVDEMSVADIAAMLGWSRSKVKVRAWRARNSLRKILKHYM
jgi:DNA-directed RNA polymerase specialized sigma24 family protein